MKRHEERKRKPLLVKRGNSTVKIYQGKSRGYDLFTVVHYANGDRKRETFGRLGPAKSRAEEIATLNENGRRDVLELSSADRESYVHAMRNLSPLNMPLHAAIEEYVAARNEIGGAALLPVLKDYAARRNQVVEKQVAEVVAEFLAAKTKSGLSSRYLQTLRSHLNRFARSFHTRIDAVTAKLIESWLDGLSLGPRGRNNIRLSIITLFHFARTHNYLPKGQPTEADEVSKSKDRGGKIGILTPKQMSKLLRKAKGMQRVYFALGGFAGLRSSETLRLDWSDFNFERGHITVAAEKSKTATRRLVPILPNLAGWIRPYRTAKGRLFATGRDAHNAIAFAKVAGIDPWPNNALRHSYGTYRLAAMPDAGRVALEMGNSPQRLIEDYRELADQHDAAAWFSIAPKVPSNVIPLAARA
jgi:integrase